MTKVKFFQKIKIDEDVLDNLNIKYLLENYVCGQKRTCGRGYTKQWVFIINEDIVIKGIYKEAQDYKIDQIVNRTKYLKKWKSSYVIFPLALITTD